MVNKRVIIPLLLLISISVAVVPVFSTDNLATGGILINVFDFISISSIRESNCTFSDFNKSNGVITLTVHAQSPNWALWIPIGNKPSNGYRHLTSTSFAVYSPYNVSVNGPSGIYIAPGLIYSNSGEDNYIIFSQCGNSKIVQPFWRCDVPAISGGTNQFFNYYFVIYGNSTITSNISISFDNYLLSSMIRLYDLTSYEEQRAFMALYTQQISNYRSNWTTGDVTGIVDDLGDIATAITKTDLSGGKSAFAGLNQLGYFFDNSLNGSGGVVDQLNNAKQSFSQSINSVTSKAVGVVPFLTVLGNFINNNWLLSSFIGVSVALFVAGIVITMLRRDK